MRRRRTTPDPGARLVFDREAGEALKADGIQRAERGAEVTWLATAAGVGRLLCRSSRDGVPDYGDLTTDDLWRALGIHGIALPREPRALGAVMLTLAREGWLKKTDRTRKSERAACHRRDLAIWQIIRRV